MPRKRASAKKHKSPIIVRWIYMKTCPHCVKMEHDWTSLTTDIKMKHSDRVDIDSVEGHNQTPVLESLSKKYLNGESIHVNGYPTIFKIENGKIHYYNGARKRHQMLKWILNIRDPFRHGMHGGKTRKNDLTRKNKTIKKNRSWLTLW